MSLTNSRNIWSLISFIIAFEFVNQQTDVHLLHISQGLPLRVQDADEKRPSPASPTFPLKKIAKFYNTHSKHTRAGEYTECVYATRYRKAYVSDAIYKPQGCHKNIRTGTMLIWEIRFSCFMVRKRMAISSASCRRRRAQNEKLYCFYKRVKWAIILEIIRSACLNELFGETWYRWYDIYSGRQDLWCYGIR